jgi:ubiquinone/menaquinone biosynthesis C-methylase UbiE
LPHSPTTAYDDLPLWSAPFGLALLDTVRPKKNISVLDIGSGSGFPMLELAMRMGRSCMVYGLDPSDEALSMIREKKEVRGIENARIIKGVAEAIPFPDETFKLIVSNNGLNNVSDQKAAMAECFRVAGPGAQMVLTMNLPHTMHEFYEVFDEVLASMDLHSLIPAVHEHIDRKRKPVEFLRELIASSGFVIRSISVDGFRVRFTDGTSFFHHHLIRIAFREPWRSVVPEERKEEVFARIEQRLNEIASEKGEFTVSIPFVCFDCNKPETQNSKLKDQNHFKK